MYYIEVFEALYKAKIKYLVVGGTAVNLHGVPRLTYDIDLIISTDRENVISLNKTLKSLGYVPLHPVNPDNLWDINIVSDWIKNKNMTAFSFYHKKEPRKVIDIVVAHPLDFNKALKRAVVKKANGIKIFVASIDDVIKMKKVSGRPKDLSDAEMLREAKKMPGQEDEK